MIAISTEYHRHLFLRSDGTVLSDRPVPDGMSNVVQVANAGEEAFALLEDGTVAAWNNGLLGPEWVTLPEAMTNDVVKIFPAEDNQTRVLKADGSFVRAIAWTLPPRSGNRRSGHPWQPEP